MVFKLVVSLEQGSKNKPLENSSRLRLICFKTSHLNLKKKSILNLLHTYVAALTLSTYNPCNGRYYLRIPLCLSTTQVIVLMLGIHNLHHKFFFPWLVSTKWVLFKMQQRKPLASKSLRRFSIEFCFKHIQWSFQSQR